jgi:hypothetical protein
MADNWTGAICWRHYRTFTDGCIRCGEAWAINESVERNKREKARRQAEFDRMALVPKRTADGVSVTSPTQSQEGNGRG